MCVGKIEQLTENKSSLNGTMVLEKRIAELTDRNQRLTLALLAISNEMIALAKKNKDVEQENLWKKRKQSYLFNK